MQVVTATWTIYDDKRRTSKFILYFDLDDTFGDAGGEKLDELVDYIHEITRRLDRVVKGAVANISISMRITKPNGLKSVPAADSDVEEGGRFTYRKTATSDFFQNVVPTFDHDIFPRGISEIQNAVNSGDHDLNQFILLLVQSPDAWSGPGFGICDNRGGQITTAPQLKKVFRGE